MLDPAKPDTPPHLDFQARTVLGMKGLLAQWRAMFSRSTFGKDLYAGAVVAAVAVPMCLAIAIASEVPPSVALVTAIVASLSVPLLNGTPLAIAGPAAALAVLVGTIVEEHGLPGLVFIAFVVGVLQLLTGALGLARFVRFVPTSVIHGFTAGIGIIIVLQQLPRAFGYPAPDEGHVLGVLLTLPELIATADPLSVTYALLAASVTLILPRRVQRIPAPLIAIASCTIIAILIEDAGPAIGEIAIGMPSPSFAAFPHSSFSSLFGDALVVFAIASAETLLTSTTVDKLTRTTRHDPDQELVGQGFGNIAASLFGGMPVSGVVARSSLNVLAGARTRLAAIVHALLLLAAVYTLPGAMAHIPLAAIAGLLIAVGLRMASFDTLRSLFAVSRTDAAVYLATMASIVVLDLLAGVQMGILVAVAVAALRLTRTRVTLDKSAGEPVRVTFRGPLTFLASVRVDPVLDGIVHADLSAGVVIDLRHVGDIDSSGADAVQRVVADAQKRGAKVALLGARPDVREALLAAGDDDSLMPGLAATVADVEKILPNISTRSHLVQGVHWLHEEHRDELGHLFEQFAEGQQPHTMFITCADSRVLPGLITGAHPGELFTVRNLGAVLPPSSVDALTSEIAAVEYAVKVLKVNSIVVCAHSNCGAMGVLSGATEAPKEGPIATWHRAAQRCVGSLGSAADRDAAARLAVSRQLDNLRSYAFVRDAEKNGDLTLHAWFYDVSAPEVYEWKPDENAFAKLVEAKG